MQQKQSQPKQTQPQQRQSQPKPQVPATPACEVDRLMAMFKTL